MRIAIVAALLLATQKRLICDSILVEVGMIPGADSGDGHGPARYNDVPVGF